MAHKYKKIAIIGSTASGKSTLANKLSKLYDLPHIELDQILFENRKRKTDDEFRDAVRLVVKEPEWICDGVFYNLADIIWPKADIVIWLDLPLKTAYKQVLSRSLGRIIKAQSKPGGQRETLKTAFGRNGIVTKTPHIHRKVTANYEELVKQYVSSDNLVRLKSRKEVSSWVGSQSK
jgi:adenylate kinase family enzyme